MKAELLFQSQLSDLLDGEKQLEGILPFLTQTIDWAPLRLTLLQHQELTRKQEKRLELVFWNLGVSPLGRKCRAIREIVDDMLLTVGTKPILETEGPSPNILSLPGAPSADARIILLLQNANSYTTASYSTLSVWAGILDYHDIIPALELCLQESRAMQRWLSSLAIRDASEAISVLAAAASAASAHV